MGEPRPLHETDRLKAFSDSVFAFAATLLVVKLEVPTDIPALLEALAGFPAFALGFAALLSLWHNHRHFFAQYPIGDGWTVVINGVLLFVVLLYVYPLKLLTEVVAQRFLGVGSGDALAMPATQVRGLYLVYGAGFVAVFAAFTALHARAWATRVALRLDAVAQRRLWHDLTIYAVIGLVGVTSIAAAAADVGLSWGLPFWLYGLAPLAVAVQRALTGGAPDVAMASAGGRQGRTGGTSGTRSLRA
jgi:uncharacterized membrane protein